MANKAKNGKRQSRRGTYDVMAKFLELNDDLTIEKKPPPPPATRFNIPEVSAYKEKLFKGVDKTPIDGAFLIPSALKAASQRYLKENYGSQFRFRYFTIPDNPELMRVYKHKASKIKA